MGKMKEYLMWQEERGYVEYDDLRGDYVATDKNPGEVRMLSEYKNMKHTTVGVTYVKEVRNEELDHGRIFQILWKVNGSHVLSSSSTKIFDGDEVVNETMFFLATENGTITSHNDLHVMYPAEFDQTKVALELHRWATEEINKWAGEENEKV